MLQDSIIWPDLRELEPRVSVHGGRIRVRLETTEERVAPNGLKIARHFSTEDHFDEQTGEHVFAGASVYDRTEAFIARVHHDKRLPGGHIVMRKGEDIVLWRMQDLVTAGWTGHRDWAHFHGYANGGNQTVSFSSDDEAEQYVTTMRNAAGRVMTVADHPKAAAWGDRYRNMMSR